MVTVTFCPGTTGPDATAGQDLLLVRVFCSDRAVRLRSVSGCVGPAVQASPELVRVGTWCPYCPRH